MQDVPPVVVRLSAFYVDGELKMKVSEAELIRWFKGELSGNKVLGIPPKVYGVYRAKFQDTTYLGEEFWSLNSNDTWEPRKAVMDWFFIGNDNLWEISEEEAKELLPPWALS